MKFIRRLCFFFAAFILYHIIFSNFFPADENGYLIAPDWYIYLGLLIALVTANMDKVKSLFKRFSAHRYTPVEPVVEPVISEKPGYIEDDHKCEPTHIPVPEPPLSTLDSIDSMDGHTFEYWCADLLRNNGFVNVSVTRGSGDQGVDVLAEKEGIRYAIQCKCYSHDLGNTPIQEVNAGRVIYHCHIGAVMTNRYFTKGAKEAAEATGVLLWDRDWIKDHLTDVPQKHLNTSRDPLLWDALDLVKSKGYANVDIVQQGLGIGYARAARIIDQLEDMGFIGPFRGSIPREIIK